MFRRIFTIAWKELLHLRKDRILVPFLLIGAVAELTLLAWATTQPIDNIDMTVVDHDQSEQSAALISALNASPTLTDKRSAASVSEVYNLMDKNRTMIGVVIPEHYGADLLAYKQPTIDLILNGTDSLSAFTAENAAKNIIFEQAMRDAFHSEPQDYAKELPKVIVKYNKNLERSYYALPAEMGFMFYMMTLIMAAFAIARERERGTYEQLLVMPYRSWEVILGKILAPMAVGYGLFLTMLALTTLAFHVPLRGSLPLLLVLAVIYLTAEVGKGILFSMAARTQLQAVLLVTGIAMIDMVFSGYMVAVENMPRFMQFLSNFFSIRHWLVITRDIMLKGVGLEVFWPHMLAIILLGIAIISVTAWQYRRSLR